MVEIRLAKQEKARKKMKKRRQHYYRCKKSFLFKKEIGDHTIQSIRNLSDCKNKLEKSKAEPLEILEMFLIKKKKIITDQ